MADITIKVGNTTLEASRKDLIEVNETPDGVTFSFKGGVQLVFVEPYMTSTTKQLIKTTADKFIDKKLIFTLDNPKRPVLVDAS